MRFILVLLLCILLSSLGFASYASDGRFGVSVDNVAYVVDFDYVYNTIYFYDGSDWIPKSCAGTQVTSDWNRDCYYDFSRDTQNLADGTYYVIAYACDQVGSGFDCNEEKWLLTSFEVGSSGTPPPSQKAHCSDGVDNDGDNKIDLQDPGCSSSSDNDEYNYVGGPTSGNTLVPGNGWSGDIPTPAARGGRTTKAIARWDVVPMQEVKNPMEVGVVAHHSYGIEKVTFSLNNGPWIEVQQPSYNPRTKVEEYWVNFDPSKVQDGKVELRAIAYPKSGQPRVLALDLWANAGGSIDFPVHYVQPGVTELPKYLEAPRDKWLTIKYAPGASQRVYFATETNGNIKLEGLNLQGRKGTYNGPGRAGQVVKLWFDDINYLGIPSTFKSKNLEDETTMWMANYHWWTVYYTDVKVDHVANPLSSNSGFARNIDVGTAYEDAIRVCGMVLNYEIDQLIAGRPGYWDANGEWNYVHTDMFQVCNGLKNGIYQNIVGKSVQGQSLSIGDTYDSAFRNINIYGVPNNIGLRLFWDAHNVLLENIDIKNTLGTDLSNVNQKDVVMRNVKSPKAER